MNERTEKDQLKRTRAKLRAARDTLNFVAQRTFAIEAPRYLRNETKLSDHPSLKSAFDEGLLHQHIFTQKSPKIWRFYQQLLATLNPRSVLEPAFTG